MNIAAFVQTTLEFFSLNKSNALKNLLAKVGDALTFLSVSFFNLELNDPLFSYHFRTLYIN